MIRTKAIIRNNLYSIKATMKTFFSSLRTVSVKRSFASFGGIAREAERKMLPRAFYKPCRNISSIKRHMFLYLLFPSHDIVFNAIKSFVEIILLLNHLLFPSTKMIFWCMSAWYVLTWCFMTLWNEQVKSIALWIENWNVKVFSSSTAIFQLEWYKNKIFNCFCLLPLQMSLREMKILSKPIGTVSSTAFEHDNFFNLCHNSFLRLPSLPAALAHTWRVSLSHKVLLHFFCVFNSIRCKCRFSVL